MNSFERHVTPAEAERGHITIPKTDHDFFHKAFGKIVTDPQARKIPGLGLKTFYLESNGKRLRLRLVYRNPPRGELRLYFNKGAGIKPKTFEVFYARKSGSRVIIGLKKSKLKKASEIVSPKVLAVKNVEESEINRLLYDDGDKKTRKQVYKRRVVLARKCFERASYNCEAGYVKPGFNSRRTGKNYLEAHHMIPVSLKRNFKADLDRIENLFALSAHAHRALHYGEPQGVWDILQRLLHKRPEIMEITGLTPELLRKIYKIR